MIVKKLGRRETHRSLSIAYNYQKPHCQIAHHSPALDYTSNNSWASFVPSKESSHVHPNSIIKHKSIVKIIKEKQEDFYQLLRSSKNIPIQGIESDGHISD